MGNWKATLSYDGTAFHGWQVQPTLPTVQATLAGAIRHVTQESVLPQGSGRTDAGVHALGQVASFALQCSIPAENLHRALNRALPRSVRLLEIEAVDEAFHARHSAKRKTYEYRIFRGQLEKGRAGSICSPMLAPFVWDCPLVLDLDRMQLASRQVVGTHDFTSFAAVDPERSARLEGDACDRGNVRTIFSSGWEERDGLTVYRVTGSGFLHHMVRNLVGCFAEVGAGRVCAEDVSTILAAKRRGAAGITAPARGLFLVEVIY